MGIRGATGILPGLIDVFAGEEVAVSGLERGELVECVAGHHVYLGTNEAVVGGMAFAPAPRFSWDASFSMRASFASPPLTRARSSSEMPTLAAS